MLTQSINNGFESGNTVIGPGTGDVLGPGASTDNAIVRWNGVMGINIQDSVVIVGDTGIMTGGTWQGNVIDIPYGGTNSSTALNNNRMMISAAGAIVENGPLTQNRIVYPDANGLPTGDANLTWDPTAQQFKANGVIYSTGTTGATPVSGAGTRFMWIPAKQALRAGSVTGTQWDNANIGLRSVAIGLNPRAEGTGTFALGEDIRVTGTNSFGISLDNGGYTISQNNVLCILGGRVGIGNINPFSHLDLRGSNISWSISKPAGNVTVGLNDNFSIYAMNTDAARTVTLPSVNTVTGTGPGREVTICDAFGTGADTNNIVISPAVGETINQQATYPINTKRGSVTLIADGSSNWFVN